MYWVADVLLVAFIGAFLYRGIKRGFINGFFTLITAILWIAAAAAASFALVHFVFSAFGWLADFQLALIDFAQGFMSLIVLLGIELTVDALALYLAYGILILVLFIPFYVFFLWVGRQFERFIEWVKTKSLFCKILGSVVGSVFNVAVASVIVLGVFWLIAALDGSGVFTYANEVLRSGYLTRLVYEYNPLYGMLGDPGSLAETVGNIISGNF